MCYCDFDPPSVYDYFFRRAAKPHRCCECGGRIEPGEKYIIHKGYWDEWMEFKWCKDCYDISIDLSGIDGCACHAFGELSQAIEESEQHGLMTRFLANAQERGVDVSGWITPWTESEHPDDPDPLRIAN